MKFKLIKSLKLINCSLIRSVTEYACSRFGIIPKYLVNALESIKKRALSIIYPSISYNYALLLSDLSSLEENRSLACTDLISKIKPSNPLYPLIKSWLVEVNNQHII